MQYEAHNSACSNENIPCLRCLPVESLLSSVLLQAIPVPPVACWSTPDALNAWRTTMRLKSVLTCVIRDKNKKATGLALAVRNTENIVMDSVLQCTQNILCFSTEGYEKPWSLNSMSGMSGDASGVSSVSALPCSPPCLMQHSHSPIPSIM